MDLYSASVYELRGELRRLIREFLPTPVSAMKRSEVIHHIEAYNEMIKKLKELPILEKGSGKLPPRPIRSITENMEGGVICSIPLFPEPRVLSSAFISKNINSPGIVENGNDQADNIHTSKKGGV